MNKTPKASVMKLRHFLLEDYEMKHSKTNSFLPFLRERDELGRLILKDKPKKETQSMTRVAKRRCKSKFERYRLIDIRVNCK